MKQRIGYVVGGSALLGGLLLGSTAFAAGPGEFGHGMTGRAPGVRGTVTTIGGNTITITSQGYGQNTTQTTYTVDATNATVTKNGTASPVSSISVGDQLSVQGTVSGTNVAATTIHDGMMGSNGRMGNGVFGTVQSVSGNTLSVTQKYGPNGTTGTTYTVDATNATVTKNGAASSVSGISVGDTVMVQGTVNGTSVTATAIHDGIPQGGRRDGAQNGAGSLSRTAPSLPQGNGQPVVGGTVTAINGSTLTITNKSNVTYSVDAGSATVTKDGATSTYSNIATGDRLIVQGSVSGTTITASSIIDSGALPQTTTNTTVQNASNGVHRGFMAGFIGGVGGFFHNLFGFF